jgi:hypothetical protein
VNLRGTTVMHGWRESDSPIVSVKLPNNGRSALCLAEGVESRGLAKGNVVQHTRGRTQCRVLPVTGARLRTASTCGCLRSTTRGRSPVR